MSRGAPAAPQIQLKVENPYFDKDQQIPTNTRNLMPSKLRPKHTPKDQLKSFRVGGKGKIVGPKPFSDGMLEQVLAPSQLHNLSNAQQYKKIIEMRHQNALHQREDAALREYSRITGGMEQRAGGPLGPAGRGRGADDEDLPGDEAEEVRKLLGRQAKHLELAQAELSGRPFVTHPSGGYETSGAMRAGAAYARQSKGKGKGKGQFAFGPPLGGGIFGGPRAPVSPPRGGGTPGAGSARSAPGTPTY